MRLTVRVLAALATTVAHLHAAPANDQFANRIVIPTTNRVQLAGNNSDATVEPGEAPLAASAGRRTVWWEWTPPATGAYLITTHESTFDTLLAVYTGNSVTGLTLVASDDNGVTPGNPNRGDLIALTNAVAGTAYKIAVDGKTNSPSGEIVLRILPNNDLYTNRIRITGNSYQGIAYNGKAGKEPGERNHATGSATPPGTTQPGKSVWWEWNPPAVGSYLVSTYPSTFATVLSVYKTNLSALDPVASDTSIYWGGDLTIDTFGNLVRFTVTSTNESYRIAVDGYTNYVGGVTNVESGFITLSLLPDNDHLANARAITGAVVNVIGFNGLATAEVGETNRTYAPQADPSNPTYNPTHSVWWKWSPPVSGPYLVSTMGSPFNTFLAVLTNTAMPPTIEGLMWAEAGGCSADNGASAYDTTSLVSLYAYSNQVYYIMADGAYDQNSENYGMIDLTIVPDNNLVANRLILTGTTASGVSYNGAANGENYEKLPPATLRDTKTIWWGWTAPTNGVATIDTFNSSFATVLAVYTGTLANFSDYQLIVWNSLGGPDRDRSIVEFPAYAGQEYRIQVTGIGATEFGEAVVQVHFQPAVPVPNDLLANAAVLTGTNASGTASNYFASKEPGEPKHAGGTGGRSLWWKWEAPGNGVVTIDTFDSVSELPDGVSLLNTLLAVYTGTNMAGLLPVASNDDNLLYAPNSSVTFTAAVGRVYYIAVDTGYIDDPLDPARQDYGLIRLHLEQAMAPVNDRFTNRIAITGLPVTVTGNNVNATRETGEYSNPNMPGGASVWWSWTAPSSGKVTFTTDGSSIDTVLTLFKGTTFSGANVIAQNDSASPGIGYSRIVTNVVKGTTYNISVEGLYGMEGEVVLSILPPLKVGGLALSPGGAAQLTFPASTFFSYEIQSSDDLTNWMTFDFITATNRTMIYTTPMPATEEKKFLRVVEW